jgi:hypothetical protein
MPPGRDPVGYHAADAQPDSRGALVYNCAPPLSVAERPP